MSLAGTSTYNKAECEPRMRLDDMSAVVAAIVATADDSFVTLDLLPKRVLTECEDEAHLVRPVRQLLVSDAN
jgi:hypothetical protein